MMYLSKGLPVQNADGVDFQVSHCGKIYALGPEMAKLWVVAKQAPQQVPAEKKHFVRRLEQSGLAATTGEQGKLAQYRLLTSCIICPEKTDSEGIDQSDRGSRVLTWIKKAGLRLTASELVRLEEQQIEPAPELLGEDGRQNLTERIYSRELICDELLETMMERSPARDDVVALLLQLLHAGKLFLV